MKLRNLKTNEIFEVLTDSQYKSMCDGQYHNLIWPDIFRLVISPGKHLLIHENQVGVEWEKIP